MLVRSNRSYQILQIVRGQFSSVQAPEASVLQLICRVAEKGGELMGAFDHMKRSFRIHETGTFLDSIHFQRNI